MTQTMYEFLSSVVRKVEQVVEPQEREILPICQNSEEIGYYFYEIFEYFHVEGNHRITLVITNEKYLVKEDKVNE